MAYNESWLVVRLVILVIAMIVTAIGEPWRRRARSQSLVTVARRLQGRHQPERRDYEGAVSWDLDGTTGLLYVTSDAGWRSNGVTVRFRKPCGFKLRIFPETDWSKIRKFLGAQDLQTGDSGFDRTYMVQTSNGAKARAALTRDVRGSMMRLTGFGNPVLELGPTGIFLRIRNGFENQSGRLTEFAAEALTLGRALIQALDPGVVFTGADVSGPGPCPVCGTAVEEDRGLCARCRTPHHKDCWTYFGGCAVFACAGRPRRMRVLPGRRPVRAA